MIVKIDMHIRDERLLEWLQDKNNQKIPAQTIAEVFKCNPHTARAMLERLERAGYIKMIRSTRGGHTIKLVSNPCNLNSH